MLAPLFGRKMTAGFASAMAQVAAALVARWQRRPDGSIVEIKAEMSRVALEALVGCIFSDGLGDPEAVCAATTRYYESCGGLDPFDPTAPRDMLGAMLAAVDPATGDRLTEVEVKDNVMTFIFGGQETTSSALTWAIYLLSQSPEWRERVAEEADKVFDGLAETAINALVHTRAVVEEALRLYPPIIGITRTARQRTELAGRMIERGTMVIISPYVLHRHRLLWREPDIFDPTRFLPGRSNMIERYTYLPFGAGPRVCIGAALAVQEATLVVATLMKHFELDLVPGQSVWPVIDFTMKPPGGLKMTAKRRRSTAKVLAAE